MTSYLGFPITQRFWDKVEKSDRCWMWSAGTSSEGYGRYYLGAENGAKRHDYAHRISYAIAHGPIPEGLHIDHLCRVRSCVNPSHLEAVTCKVNLLRGETVTARNASVTHCPSGHPYSGENLLVNNRGQRQCASCKRSYNDKYRGRRKMLLKGGAA